MNYDASLIVAKASNTEGANDDIKVMQKQQAISKPQLATKIDIGKRMPSFKVLNQSDARPWHLQELLKSNGRWRLIIFPGRLTEPSNMQRLQALGEKLAESDSFVRRFTPPDQPIDSVIEILTIHAGPRSEIELLDLPEAFHPYHRDNGWDYWKVYVDDDSYHEGHGQAYANYGIDPDKGASVIVRPDQYVSWVGDMDGYDELSRFFSAFMKPQVTGEPEVDSAGVPLIPTKL